MIKYTIVGEPGQLMLADKPKPSSKEYWNGLDEFNQDRYQADLRYWKKSLRPIKDQEGIRDLAFITWRDNPPYLEQFHDALLSGIEVESERLKVVQGCDLCLEPRFPEVCKNGKHYGKDISYLVLLPEVSKEREVSDKEKIKQLEKMNTELVELIKSHMDFGGIYKFKEILKKYETKS